MKLFQKILSCVLVGITTLSLLSVCASAQIVKGDKLPLTTEQFGALAEKTDSNKYFIIFYEEHRDNRVEMSSFNADDGFIVTLNKTVTVSKQKGDVRQYYYDEKQNKFIFRDTWNKPTDNCAGIIASNVDIYNINGTVAFKKNYPSAQTKKTAETASAEITPKLCRSSVTLTVGSSLQLYFDRAFDTITWSSSDKSVATVNKGKVTAKKAGTAVITAYHGKTAYKCKVTVVSYKLSAKSSMSTGDTQTLKLTGVSDTSKIDWYSDDEKILSVDKNGKVTARMAGIAKISAVYNGYKYSVAITVSGTKPKAIGTYAGHTYAIFDTGCGWDYAVSLCKTLGGHLATITSDKEQLKIESLLEKGAKNSYWLGGKRLSGKQFEWITGEDFSYSNWAISEPNNYTRTEDALMIYKEKNPKGSNVILGQWNDVQFDGICKEETFFGPDNFGFICEWEF